MSENQKEIIAWLCSTEDDKFQKGLALIQKYHGNKGYYQALAGFITQEKKDKMEYELSKLAGYTIPEYHEKKWLHDNLEQISLTGDTICPQCGEPYTPQEGGDQLCPDCIELKKKLDDLDSVLNPDQQSDPQPEQKETPVPDPQPDLISEPTTELPQDPQPEILESPVPAPKPAPAKKGQSNPTPEAPKETSSPE